MHLTHLPKVLIGTNLVLVLQVWLGTGGDLGGSLRIPASFCGIVGLRPSVGLVPQAFGNFDDVKTVSGPMGRNVADLALLLDAMSGQHPKCAPVLHFFLGAAWQILLLFGLMTNDKCLMQGKVLQRA